MWLLDIILHNVLVWKTNFHRFGITAYDDICLLHIVCFVDRVCLVSAKIKFGFVFFRCTHFKDAIKHLLNSEPNQIFGEVGYLCLDLCLMLVVAVSAGFCSCTRLLALDLR